MDGNALTIDEKHRVSVAVRNLTVSVKDPKSSWMQRKFKPSTVPLKSILDNVSFDVAAGSFVAIMGGTGSGKTTLLNTLSTRLNIHQTLHFQGSITYQTQEADSYIPNSYLLQTDVFLPGLSVEETLRFQADIRMPPHLTMDEKRATVDSLLDVLELSHMRDTRVSNYTGTTTLSGGEQRRLSLAIQLLNRPSVVFLDEPTTGLDASNSLRLIQVVKKLTGTEYGMTVLCAIHQPRIEVTKMFDQVCVLAKGGRLVYNGTVPDAEKYFGSISWLQSRKSANLLDYIMSLSVKDTRSKDLEKATSVRIDRLVAHWKEVMPFQQEIPSEKDSREGFEAIIKVFTRPHSTRHSFMNELKVLTHRSFILCLRDRMSLLSFLGGIIVLGCGFGWLFFRPHHDVAGIRSFSGALYTTLQVIGFTPMFVELERIWGADGQNFFREYKDNCVSVPGFVFSRRLGRLLLEDIPITLIWTILTYFMWGLRGGVGHFFIYYLLTFLTEVSGMVLALFCFGVGPEFAVSALILNVYYQVQNSSCGFFVNSRTMPVYVRWLKYCAYFWYTYGAMIWNQFHNWMGDCPSDLTDCSAYSGDSRIQILGFPKNFLWQQVGICIAWIILYAILAVLSLRYIKNYDISMASTKKNRYGDEEDERKFVRPSKSREDEKDLHEFAESNQSSSAIDGISISLKNTNLEAWKSNLITLVHKTNSKLLLRDFSASFEANKLNVIMGPSGSGKTTLLNYLSHRLPRSTRFQAQGSIFLNSTEVTSKQLGSVSAYVTQHDNTLIPALTVRETLHFQAKLRLPPEEIPRLNPIVNGLLRQMGLLDCADTVIGNDVIKGVSGGEKRRVSIAVQLLNRPRILFLDEPTSGLDSTTAYSILSLLHQLGSEGQTTVVLTIHQPSEEMLHFFDKILLLGKYGRVVYNGKVESMSEHFTNCGYPIHHHTNVADFIMDLVSRGYGESVEVSEARINHLVQVWSSTNNETTAPCGPSVNLSQLRRSKASFWNVLVTITSRQTLATFRTPDVLFTRGFQGVALAVFYTLFFAPLRNGAEGVDNRLGLIQSLLNIYFVGLLNNISLYPMERGIFYQEYKDGIYGSVQYNLSYIFNEIPFEVFQCILFSVLCVFGIGMPRTASMFFVNFYTMFAAVNCGESVGIMWNSVFDHLGFATNLMSMCILFAVFMGGTMSMQLPGFFRGINWINPMKYVVRSNANLIFKNETFHCGSESCVFDYGYQVLDYFKLNGSLGLNLLGVTICMVAYRLVAIGLCIIKVRYFI
ncbi:hypothetical protein DIURU_005653 [Diutina rugosa]|uniref:ABC transporter domain-containing protein n=1 Tax=Diutina rugosa TaxID=5481 RepID=A0A642UCA8_DIURU|nr:uncharacterized protein DIURU_005653 [Diutina rugosa]KAA8896641.1 hypothetical protein DIURU_005653 [Diutina rugosa]